MKKLALIIILGVCFSCAFEDPYFMTIEAHNGNCRIIIDDKFADLSDLKFAIYDKTKDYDSVKKSKFYIKLKVSNETSMGLISDIEKELKKERITRIKHYRVKARKCLQM